MQYRLTPLAAALAVAFIVPMTSPLLAQAQTAQDAKADQALPSVTVNASADASADGLPAPYAGGQVARGGRIGLLGNQDFMSTPYSITSYTQEFIKDSQARSVGDVLLNNPSIQVTRGFGNYQESYMIRGFIADSDTLAYNGLYGVLPRQYTASELLERVEVFLGASAFLNGAPPGSAGGLGGTINLLPKRATNDPITQATVGYETGGQGYYALDLGRRFGPEDRVGVRVNAVRRAGGTGVNGENRELGLLAVGLDYRGNDFRLSADVGFQDYRLNNIQPSLKLAAGVAVPSAPDASRNFGEQWTYSNERDVFATVRGEFDITSDITAWGAFGTRSSNEANVLAGATLTNNNGTLGMARFDNTREDTVYTGEVGIRAKLKTGSVGHSINASASSYWQDTRNAYAMLFFGAPMASNLYNPTYAPISASLVDLFGNSLASPQTTTKTMLSSVALADTMSFADDRVLLTVGARHQTIKSQTFAYTTHVESARYNKSAITPSVGLVVKPLKDLSLYANYIEGLQPGQEVTYIGSPNYGTVLAPFKSRQKEVGAKYDMGNVAFGLALFTTGKPLQDSHGDSAGDQKNRGVELTAVGSPMRGVRIMSGITFLHAKQENTGKATTEGKDALGVPRTQANLGGEWDIPGVAGLSVNGRVTYTSTQYVDSANTQKVPAWERYDLGVRYITTLASHMVTFRGAVQNLTNKNYWASAGGASDAGYLVLGAPRTFVTSMSVDF